MADIFDEFAGTVPLSVGHQPKHLIRESICHSCIRVGVQPDQPCSILEGK
jgi:hypothetical protein